MNPWQAKDLRELTVSTHARSEMIDITRLLEEQLGRSGTRDGIVAISVPHTTAGLTIQENADPDVRHDVLAKLDRLFPKDEPYFRHAEGNSDSHLKTIFTGTTATLIVSNGRFVLGRWQGVYLCEFDGPRQRQVLMKTIPSHPNDAD